MQRLSNTSHTQTITININIIQQNINLIINRILRNRSIIINSNRNIIHTRNRNINQSTIRTTTTITNRITKRIRTTKISIRRIIHIITILSRSNTINRIRNRHNRQIITININIIYKHINLIITRILQNRSNIIIRSRRIIHTRNRNINSSTIRTTTTITNRITKLIRTTKISIRRIINKTNSKRHTTMSRNRNTSNIQIITININIIT